MIADAGELVRVARLAARRCVPAEQVDDMTQDVVERALLLAREQRYTSAEHLLSSVFQVARWTRLSRWARLRYRARDSAVVELQPWQGATSFPVEEAIDADRLLLALEAADPEGFEALCQGRPGPVQLRARRWLCEQMGLPWKRTTSKGRLDEEAARSMRAMRTVEGTSYPELGRRFGVSHTTAWLVVQNQIWKEPST